MLQVCGSPHVAEPQQSDALSVHLEGSGSGEADGAGAGGAVVDGAGAGVAPPCPEAVTSISAQLGTPSASVPDSAYYYNVLAA